MKKYFVLVSVFLLSLLSAVTESNACERSVGPGYGYSEQDPIKVGCRPESGPRNERNFLMRLRGPEGERVRFNRLGSCCQFQHKEQCPPDRVKCDTCQYQGLLDKYEVYHEGLSAPVILYLDMYRYENPCAPKGFVMIESEKPE